MRHHRLSPPRRAHALGVAAAASLLLAVALPAVAQTDPKPSATPARMPEGLGPAPVSEAERAALQLAIAYLADGPEAWQRKLASDSPWSSLSAADAAAEIAARVGPAKDSRWMLQRPGPGAPQGVVVFAVEHHSGMEEALWLQLAKGGDGWQLRELRTLAEPWPAAPATAPEYDKLAWGPAPRGGESSAGRHAANGVEAAAVATALLVLLAGAALAAAAPRRRAFAGAALAVVAMAALACSKLGEGKAGDAAVDHPSLRALAPLRAALAAGATGDELKPLLDALPTKGMAADVARLWRADLMLRQFRVNEAEDILASVPETVNFPLVDLLRARLAALRGDGAGALEAYERVRASGADHDGLRLEAAVTVSSLGHEEAADKAFARLAAIGSRLALPYYAAAELAIVEDRDEEAESFFTTAWQLQPVSRDELFASPMLATLCTRENVFALLDLGAMEEPRLAALPVADKALKLPAGAAASVSGDLLRLELGGGELWVPGGGGLAPAGAAVEAPAALAQRDRTRAVAELATLQELASTAGAFAQPGLRRRLELAALALAEQERWGEVLTLTAALPSFEGRMPPLLTRIRAAALARSEKRREALSLLVKLAKNDKQQGRRDAGALYQLADLLVREQEYDLAVKALRRASAVSGREDGAQRVKQVEMEKRLAAGHLERETTHFRIRYPKVSGQEYVDQVARVLEEERKRLARWIPVPDPQPIDVDLYPVHEFLSAYSGNLDIVGLFDGRVRVPLADLRSLHPELVAILSHELAHAMITQATADRAPKWVQEGLAQHVEMALQVPNPYPDLAEADRVLSLAVVEHALGGFSEPQFVGLSYAEAAWTIHYFESQHGVASIHRLLRAYRDGGDTDAAVQAAVRLDLAGLDGRVRDWASQRAPKMWTTEVRRYDLEAERMQLTGRDAAPITSRAVPTPRPGTAGGPLRKTPPTAAEMAAWHQGYATATRDAKAALGPVVTLYRGGSAATTGSMAEACKRLADETAEVLGNAAVFEAPDQGVANALRNAFTCLRQMAGSCLQGDHHRARAELDRCEGHLGSAAAELKPYRLRP